MHQLQQDIHQFRARRTADLEGLEEDVAAGEEEADGIGNEDEDENPEDAPNAVRHLVAALLFVCLLIRRRLAMT